ncbi:MAG: acetyl-CoA carboxylase carboxyltransferase subunit alpha [Parachlamydiales bacterium]
MSYQPLEHEKQIQEYEQALEQIRQGKEGSALLTSKEADKLEKKLEGLKKKVYSHLSPVQRLAICRHPARLHAIDYIRALCHDFVELHGDRTFGDDGAIIGGLGRIGGQKFMIIGQEKGADTEDRIRRNFGSPHPEGFRKAMRLMELAAKFGLPVVNLVDTQGAYPGLTAEERGQAWAIATNLQKMASLPTPIIVVVIGEAGSGGALAIAVGDQIGMLEHGYYSVISPEGCASILWRDAAKKGQAAEALKLNAEHLLEYEVIDTIIPEPLGGVHHDPAEAKKNVESFILSSWNRLRNVSIPELLERRYQKFRKLGKHDSPN